MGKCTKSRCPMQVGTVDENCDIKDCPYRTDSDDLIKKVCESLTKYVENSVEVTKKVRLPKGDTCDGCFFKKYEHYSPMLQNYDCVGGYAWCPLYGERLQLKGDFLNSTMAAIAKPENWTYCKCKACLDDTNAQK